jgi:hypothetical protein
MLGYTECVIRPSTAPIAHVDHARRRRCGFHELQADVFALWKQPLATAQYEWVDVHGVFVHEVVFDQRVCQHAADQLGVKPGERRYLPNLRVTLDADWVCNLAITWTRAAPTSAAELCVLMANLRPSGWVLRHYLKRMISRSRFATINLAALSSKPRI